MVLDSVELKSVAGRRGRSVKSSSSVVGEVYSVQGFVQSCSCRFPVVEKAEEVAAVVVGTVAVIAEMTGVRKSDQCLIGVEAAEIGAVLAVMIV